MDPTTLGHRIGGAWRQDGEWTRDTNPADPDQLVARFPMDHDGTVLRDAVAAARAALPEWARTPALQRAEVLFRAGGLIAERAESLAAELCREEGKPIAEARAEVGRASAILRYFAGRAADEIGHVYGSAQHGTRALTLQQPLGVVGVITPWNFPIAIPAWKIAPAIVYGNTVVFKPAEATPLLAARFVEALVDSGMPPGVVNLVFAPGPVTGSALIGPSGVDAISFTGSNAVGRRLEVAAAEAHCKIQLELGGKNAVVVAEDADFDRAVEHVLLGAFGSSGQKCTATSRVIAVGSSYRPLLDRLTAAVAGLRAGDPLDPATTIGPLISADAAARVSSRVAAAVAAGATSLARTDVPDRGWFHPAVLLGDVDPGMAVAREELFGPVLAVLPATDLDEALAVHNSVGFGLSGAIFSRDLATVSRFTHAARVGIVHVNGQTAGAEPHLPFGGMGDSSSWSREQGRAAELFYTQTKTVYLDGLPEAGLFDHTASGR